MQVEIVTPLGEKFSGEAVVVRARGAIGEFGVLPGHRDMLTALGTGVCQVTPAVHAEPIRFVLDEGYLQVTEVGKKVIIVTELAERRDEVDPNAARADYDAARAELEAAREAVGSHAWKVKRHAVELARARLELCDAL
jgi:F-type H+-transporting ATPase subunit epsilon